MPFASMWLAMCFIGCSEHEGVRSPSHSVDLLARLETAEVSLSHPEWIVGPLGPARASDLVLRDEMDGASAGRWWSEQIHSATLVEVDGESVLALSAADPPTSILLPSTGEDVYRIQVRWRAHDSSRATLVARGLPGAPRRYDDAVEARELVRRLVPGLAASPSATALDPGPDWQERQILLAPDSGRETLLLRLRATEGVVHVDRLEVRRLTRREAYVQLAERSSNLPELYRRIALPRETFDALLLLAGSRVRWEVVIPSRAPRLDTEVRVLDGPTETADAPVSDDHFEVSRVADATAMTLSIDGEAAATLRVAGGTAAADPRAWSVPLDDHAGRSAAIELSFEGDPGAVALLTAPRLLGSGDARPAVVLVSLDTLRADHLGAYGETRPLSPNLDRLAREGTVFERALSPASYTLPTHVTLLTGQHPLVHGVRRSTERIDPRRSPTLAERLRAEGYATAAFTAGGFVDPAFGFSRGFDQYSTVDPAMWEEREGGPPMERALDWMDRHRDRPYFIFVHTYLVHGYSPRQRYLDRIAPDAEIDLEEPSIGPAREAIHRRNKHLIDRAERGDAAALESLRTLYAATVAQADEEVVGALVAALEQRGEWAGSAIVAVLSDHGEEFLEHGELGHGRGLWRELVDVPWILWGHGVPADRRWPDPVELADVTPTILGRLGLSVPESQTGRDLLGSVPSTAPEGSTPLVDADEVVLHHVLDDGSRWDGLVASRWKLLRHQEGETVDWYLFDLVRDPGETTNRATEASDRLVEMRAGLQEQARRLLAASPPDPGSEPREGELPQALVEELRALGYLDLE